MTKEMKNLPRRRRRRRRNVNDTKSIIIVIMNWFILRHENPTESNLCRYYNGQWILEGSIFVQLRCFKQTKSKGIHVPKLELPNSSINSPIFRARTRTLTQAFREMTHAVKLIGPT